MTEFIIAGRAAGKTHALIEKMLDDPEMVYVGHTHAAAMHEFETYMDLLAIRTGRRPPSNSLRYGEVRRRFISTDAAHEVLRGTPRDMRVVVDNVELILLNYLGRMPDVITGTGTTTTIRPLNTEVCTHD